MLAFTILGVAVALLALACLALHRRVAALERHCPACGTRPCQEELLHR